MAKKRTSRRPPSKLLSELQVEFYTPLSLDECVERLENVKRSQHHLASSEFALHITNADAMQIDFLMKAGSLAWFTGYIRQNGQGGFLKGVVGLESGVFYNGCLAAGIPFCILTLALFSPVTLLILLGTLVWLSFGIFIMWLYYRMAFQRRVELIIILEEALQSTASLTRP